MNKLITVKRLLLFVMISMTLMLNISSNNINIDAAGETEYLTTGSGSYLTYRNSSEKVLALSEYDYPIQEYRACWVSNLTGDISSFSSPNNFKAEANTILNNMQEMGMNALVFHIRTHNNALYDSELNPRATYWANVNFDVFDPLTWLIEECHNRGIEFHAWLNPYRVNSSYVVNGQYPAGHPCNDSSNLLQSGNSIILNPGLQNVRDFITDSCMEIIEKYDVDAIHFDDYFYISGVETSKSDDWKREQVDSFIEQLHNEMTIVNERDGRNVQLGISPSGIYRNGSYSSTPTYNTNGELTSPMGSNTSGFAHYGNYLYSDTLHWINEGWIDYITPQAYWGLEHTAASFASLTRWWSWAVDKKPCNLYMGVGIYMAVGTGSSATYWQKNPNEVKNQILNAAMYDQIDGLCFFKYSNMQSSNTIIKNGVDLISDDYWAKKVPSAVQKSFADKIPSYQVENIVLVGNELTWDEIDNVRGYMVYQVPKGMSYDKNNIDYLLSYTQSNSIEISDVVNYDYYVCSVNKANVISQETRLASGSSIAPYENVINQINKLPTSITLDNEAAVNRVLALYNNLSASDKLLVTNYSILENAVDIISKQKELKQQVDTYLNTLNDDLVDGTILTPPTNMQWSYKNAGDIAKYNLTSGKKLIHYLAQNQITLVLTATKEDISYKVEKSFNLGLISSQYTALIYRDDASCMTPYDEGVYKEGETGYIGWSKAILYVDDFALPIAYGNYIRVEDTTIEQSNWHSCGAVYYNATDANISILPSVAYDTPAESYGNFIIGINGKVVKINDTTPANTAITLSPGQYLVFIRYLDRICASSPYSSLSWINQSTNASVVQYTDSYEQTDQDKIDAVIAAINLLPETITVEDEQQINQVSNLYNSLSEENKTKVTNYDKLTKAKADLDIVLKEYQALKLIKDNAKQELKDYISLSDYSQSSQTTIKGYLTTANAEIEKANNETEINTIVSNTKTKIDKIKTLAIELEEAKVAANDSLDKYLDKTNYSEAKIIEIDKILDTAYKEINAITNIDDICSKVANVKLALDAIPNKENELQDAKDKAIDLLYASYDSDNYDDSVASDIFNYCFDVELSISSATTVSEVNTLITTALAEIAKYPTVKQLIEYRQNAISKIDEFISTCEVVDAIKDSVNNEANEKKAQINDATDADRINRYADSAITNISRIIKDYLSDYQKAEYAKVVETIDTSLQTVSSIKGIMDDYKTKINSAPTVSEVDNLCVEFQNRLTIEISIYSLKEQVIKEINDFIKEEEIASSLVTSINSLVKEKVDLINKASSVEEINNIKKQTIDAVTDMIYQNLKNYIVEQMNIVENGLDSSVVDDEIIKELITTYRSLLEEATSMSEASSLINEMKAKIASRTAELSSPSNNCKKQATNYFITMISTLSLLVLVTRKKYHR